MKRIVFVCTANMCRSALAEVVLNDELSKHGIENIEVMSVGIKDLHSVPRDPILAQIAATYDYGVDGTTVYMHDVWPSVENADMIVVMNEHHRNELTKHLPYNNWNRIHYFTEFCAGNISEIPDPYYQTEAVYRKSIELIIDGCKNLAKILEGAI